MQMLGCNNLLKNNFDGTLARNRKHGSAVFPFQLPSEHLVLLCGSYICGEGTISPARVHNTSQHSITDHLLCVMLLLLQIKYGFSLQPEFEK